jgi:hypothetical protein
VSIDPVIDLNGDGVVDGEDLLCMTTQWGTDDTLCDIGPTLWGDGIVDEKDMAVLLKSTSSPAFHTSEVPCDAILSWLSPDFAETHNVYFGTSRDDVSRANRSDPRGVLVSQDQPATTCDPDGLLEFSRTYYWRVDFVTSGPAPTIYKGPILDFTTEALAYPIHANSISATASSTMAGSSPRKTVDGAGLDENDLHSRTLTEMWLSNIAGPQPSWIEYQFDKVYKLHEMWVWNQNQGIESAIGYGFRDVLVEYSIDGVDYTTLGTTHEFAQAPGTPGYAHDTTVDFGGTTAKYVRLTAKSNWGGLIQQYGLSEVRFFYVPVRARRPQPDSGATDVDLDVTLDWTAGRDAASDNVYLGADANAPDWVGSVTDPGFDAASLGLLLGQTYHWRVDEVNDAETPTTWQGDVWNFTTQEFIVVEDFESYNDIESGQEGSDLIYETWSDGFGVSTNGATMGYTVPFEPTMESTIVYEGKQSAPFFYDNTVAGYSEFSANTDALAVGRNWTKGSPTTLTLRFYGNPNNAVGEQFYAKIGDTKVVYPGDVTELARSRWSEWPIDLTGMDLSNVPALAIGFERTGAIGGAGVVYLDEIHLDRSASEIVAANPVVNGDFEYWSDHPNAGNWANIATIQDDPGVAWYAHDTDAGSGGAWVQDKYHAHIVGTDGDRTVVMGFGDTTAIVSQDLGIAFITGRTYTFSIDIFGDGPGGQHWAVGIGSADMNNRNALERQRSALAITASNAVAGSNYFANPSDYTTRAPADVFGGWQTRSVSYTATAADAGKEIVVFFSGGFAEVGTDERTCFDNARLVTD